MLYTNEFVEQMPFWPDGMDPSTVKNLACFHHKPDTPEHWFIANADRLSSGMEREDDPDAGAGSSTSIRRVRMRSIAASISGSGAEPAAKASFNLAPLSSVAAFPVSDPPDVDLTSGYRGLWDAFCREWSINRCQVPLGFINRAASILERYPTNVRGVTIRGNYFDAKGQGIFGGAIDAKDGKEKGECTDVLVENNVVINTHLRCFSMFTTNNVVCRNNLFGFMPEQLAGGKPMGGEALLYMNNWGGGEYVFANNICRGCSEAEREHLTIKGNVYLLEKPKVAGNVGPVDLGSIFADYVKHDYTIKAGSPTIDAAVAEHAAKTDILGRPRGEKPDIGPVEYSAEDTKPLLEQFLELLKKRQEEIRASTIYQAETGPAKSD